MYRVMNTFTLPPPLNLGLSSGFTFPERLPELVAQSSSAPLGANLQFGSSLNYEDKTAGDTSVSVFDDGFDSTANMCEFLSRRVKLQEIQWEADTTLNVTIDVWKRWLNKVSIANKLTNYYLFKGDLKLTFFINGNPFQYGLLLASYEYWPTGLISIETLTRVSQRPHLWLNPTTNKGGEMTVPFYYPYNFMKLVNPDPQPDFMGSVTIQSIEPLRQINAGSAEVTVTVFAEMVNVKISGATTQLIDIGGPSLQAQSGVVSNDSHPNHDHTRSFKNSPLANLANIDFADTSQRLTLSHNSTIDTNNLTVGLPSEDELSIKYLSQKESILMDFDWNVNTPPGDTIASFEVNPMSEFRTVAFANTVPAGVEYRQTSLSMAGRPFSYWSGTLKYRFQIMASQYHRGRLAFVYDPVGPLGATPFNTTYNTIVDLEDGRDFTIEVPWQQNTPYKDVGSIGIGETWSANAGSNLRVGSTETSNGVLYCVIVNSLTVPDNISFADIVVSISAGEDFEYFNPSGLIDRFSIFPPVAPTPTLQSANPLFSIASKLLPKKKKKKDKTKESKEPLVAQSAVEVTPDTENAPESTTCENPGSGISVNSTVKHKYYFGVQASSILDLCKRFTYYRTFHTNDVSTVALHRFVWTLPNYPMHAGANPNGFEEAYAVFEPSGPEITRYTYTAQSYITFFEKAYSGWKGSVKYKMISENDCEGIGVIRYTGVQSNNPISPEPFVLASPYSETPTQFAYSSLLAYTSSGSGTAFVPTRTMNSLEVELPYARPTRFTRVEPRFLTSIDEFDHGDSFALQVVTDSGASNSVDTFVAAGDDFRFYGFVGAPTVYTYTQIPVPEVV